MWLQAAPQEVLSRQAAEAAVLDEYDLRGGDGEFKLPLVRPGDRPALKWLIAVASSVDPANPFPKRGRDWKEAEAIRGLWAAAPEEWPRLIAAQTLVLNGSKLAFWRWGQQQVRNHRMGPELRRTWEDHLLAAPRVPMVFGYALRHALSFALAEADESRLGVLKDRWSEEDPDQFLAFQRAFALLGAPSPRFRIWRLPDIRPDDLTFSEMGGRVLWIAEDSGKTLPELGEGTTWIVPTADGSQPEGSDSLEGPTQRQAENLTQRLQAVGRKAFLAPVREPFVKCALMYFPIRVELAEGGTIRSILMGDAALAGSVSK